MSALADHPSLSRIKALMVADSGTGKTGALASLIDAGYYMRILDFDGGLDILPRYVKDKSKLANVHYVTLKDRFKIVGNQMVINKAPSFQRAMSLMENWKEGDVSLGAVETWGTDTIFVIDTLGKMSRASLNMVLQANGFIGKPPEIQHWGTAMENVERVLTNLNSDDVVKCHLIVNTHLTYQEAADGMNRPYPEAIGTKLNPKIARDFNNMFGLKIMGTERKIHTSRMGTFALKSCSPDLKETYPVSTGWAEIFEALVGPPPSKATLKAA